MKSFLLIFDLILILSSCTVPPENSCDGEVADAHRFYISETVDANGITTVFWSEGGSVWHQKKDCHALSNSPHVFEGCIADAKGAGKARVCKKCS